MEKKNEQERRWEKNTDIKKRIHVEKKQKKESHEKEEKVRNNLKTINYNYKMENIQLIFGSDHAGYEMKEKLINFYSLSSHSIVSGVADAGCFSNERVDYPDYA